MTQQEIKFFWPLTEQISLDLDYSQCGSHESYMRVLGITGLHSPLSTGPVYVTDPLSASPVVSINANVLTIRGLKMPWYRKIIFKLIGFKYD